MSSALLQEKVLPAAPFLPAETVGPGRPWQIIGIYIGERQTEAFGRPQNVGYAARLDACHKLAPRNCGRPDAGRALAKASTSSPMLTHSATTVVESRSNTHGRAIDA